MDWHNSVMDPLLAVKTTKGCYAFTMVEDLEEPFSRYLKNDGFFYDLGAGDGRVVEMALKFNPESYGFEYEPNPHKNVIQEDFMMVPIYHYQYLYYYLAGTDDEENLIRKLNTEFKGILFLYHRGVNPEEFIKELDFEIVEEFKNITVLKWPQLTL